MDFAAASDFLKRRYDDKPAKALAFGPESDPGVGLVKKKQEMEGDSWSYPVHFGYHQGESPILETAQAITGGEQGVQFRLTLTDFKDSYGIARIGRKVTKAAKSNAATFLNHATGKIDGTFKTIGWRMAHAWYRDGTGIIGRISTTEASLADTSITLATTSDAIFFGVGMRIQLVDGALLTSALRDSGAALTVSGTNNNTGVITTSANWNTIAAAAAGDYIVPEGAFVGGGVARRMLGVQSWSPSAAPAATAFWGVDRTESSYTYGPRFDGTGGPILEAIQDSSFNSGERHGHGKQRVCLLHPSRFLRALKDVQGEVVRTVVPSRDPDMVNVGFSGISIDGYDGEVVLMKAPACPPTMGVLMDPDAGSIVSIGQTVELDNEFGTAANGFLRLGAQDGAEARVISYHEQMWDNPSSLVTIDLD